MNAAVFIDAKIIDRCCQKQNNVCIIVAEAFLLSNTFAIIGANGIRDVQGTQISKWLHSTSFLLNYG